MEEEEKKKTRVSRAPQIEVGHEVLFICDDDGRIAFGCNTTTTIDAEGDIPIGRITVPKGYVLLIEGTHVLNQMKLMAAPQILAGGREYYVSLHVVNVSPDLRRVYNSEDTMQCVAHGVLIKSIPKIKFISKGEN